MKHNGANQKLGWGREDGCVKRSCELGGQGSHAPSQAELHSQVTHKAQHTVWSPPFAPKRGSSCRSLPQHPIPLWCSRLISDLGPAAKETIPLTPTLRHCPIKHEFKLNMNREKGQVKVLPVPKGWGRLLRHVGTWVHPGERRLQRHSRAPKL